jgi:Cu+-exporting ATPase
MLKVNGMTCAMCAKTITNTFEHYDGIEAKVNVGAGKVLFHYDESKYSIVDIAQMVKEVGYEPVLEETLEENKKVRSKMKRELLVSIFFSIPLLWAMFGHIEWTSNWYVPALFMNGIFQLIVAGVVQFYIGKRFFMGAYHGIKKKSLGMDILVVLGTTSAYVYSLYLLYRELFVEASMHPMYYFEISALIITMVLLGNYIEHIAKEKTTDAIVSLLNLGAKEARVLRGGIEVMVPIDEVVLGDRLAVLANEKVPVDGRVIEGTTYIDESMITGESIPVSKKENDSVIGATINVRQKIIMEATKVGQDTMLNQIVQTVEEASAEKPPIQRIADKIASWFVPAVVSIAFVNFLIHFLFIQDGFTYSFTTTVAILVISCPCALGLATPTSVLVGNGLAAQNHILYKGGEFFETANTIKAIAFDKTGTLTEGKPVVTDYTGDQETLEYIYAIEKESTHPISKAVVEYASGKVVSNTVSVSDFETVQGKGIKANVNGKNIAIGNGKLMDQEQVDYKGFIKQYDGFSSQAKTVNYVAVDGILKALYAVRDEIKDTTKSVIREMKQRGLVPFMITGDNKRVARQIASEIGIEEFYAEVLPNEKADIVRKIQERYGVVAFVGDGINDAPALKVADVGFAMGHGTDVAIDSSDVTIMSYDLGLVVQAIDISKATLKNIYQNFAWAFSYNVVAIPLAATGNLSMAVAAAAMAFSSIMVVLNALRLKTYKLQEFIVEEKKGVNMLKIKVPDMTCGHCKMTIEKALSSVGVSQVNIDLASHEVELDLGTVDKEVALQAIKEKGYTIEF